MFQTACFLFGIISKKEYILEFNQLDKGREEEVLPQSSLVITICAKNTRLIKAHISYTLCVCLCVSLNVHHLSEIRLVRVLLILCHGYSQLQD